MYRPTHLALALLALSAPAWAQNDKPAQLDPSTLSKETLHVQMRDLATRIEQMRASGAPLVRIDQLQQQYQAISTYLGGDEPVNQGSALGATSTSGSQEIVAPICTGFPVSTANFVGTNGPITPPTVQTYQPQVFTVAVSGLGTYLWDLNLNTEISHTYPGDCDITLTSPAGTVVIVTTDNANGPDNVFNGTLWDDNVNIPVTDVAFVNNTVVPQVSPEGRFQAFRGEDPNGTWTLTIADDAGIDTGNLNSWSLDISTLAGAPVESTTNTASSPALAIPDVSFVTDSVIVAGAGTYLSKLVLNLAVTHTENADLDITLTSPAGTIVTVSTDNGGALDDVFNGTACDPDGTDTITDHVYTNLVVATPLTPEGAFDNFLGQDPNGTWTLTITDDLSGDVGTLVSWSLDVTTAVPPSPSAPANFAGTGGFLPDFTTGTTAVPVPTVYTCSVSGVGTSLWDLDLTTFVNHTSAGDIDMTLRSPAGTVIWITSDNGGTLDLVFNGTLWDDNANDVTTDRTYTNLVLASPLSPEGRLAAFRGEDPNGEWTLTITDDAAADNGSLDAWSLDVTTTSGPVNGPTANVTQSPGLLIPAGAPGTTSGTISDVMVVGGLGNFIREVTLYVEITHTYIGDLDLLLTSPFGTVIRVASNNGGTAENSYNGTLFAGTSTLAPTEYVYTNLVAAPLLASEGSLDNLLGEDPNGNWTLTIVDELGGDWGTLVRWDLNITTCPTNGASFCSNGTLGVDHTTACPCGNAGLADRGCGHSFDPSGAKIDASGSIAADTVILHSSFEPAASFTLFMQHTLPADTIFHDGVLCAGGVLTRLRGRNAGVTQFQPPGEAIFPNSNFANDATLTLSSRGGTFPGSGATRFYSAFYRNASTTFCPPATANVTNGWVITW